MALKLYLLPSHNVIYLPASHDTPQAIEAACDVLKIDPDTEAVEILEFMNVVPMLTVTRRLDKRELFYKEPQFNVTSFRRK